MAVVKLRKKPIEVEAVRFTGDNHEECRAFAGDCYVEKDGKPAIRTLEGDMNINPNSMIVKGVHGEFYPVHGHVLDETYEEFEDGENQAPGKPGPTDVDQPAQSGDLPEDVSDGTDNFDEAVVSTESVWTAEQREAAPESAWAIPEMKKLRIDNANHARLAWSMVNRVKGASDKQKVEARKRILRAAKKFDIDTKDWGHSQESLEAYADLRPDRTFRMDGLPYLFNMLSEESGELVQASCKAIRFGINSIDPRNGLSARDKIREEYFDVVAVMQLIDEELASRGYDTVIAGVNPRYGQARFLKRETSLHDEYARGNFTLPGENQTMPIPADLSNL